MAGITSTEQRPSGSAGVRRVLLTIVAGVLVMVLAVVALADVSVTGAIIAILVVGALLVGWTSIATSTGAGM
jgi:uncharacterized membrane protein YgaE (UPF0421/DUF939 family)